MVSQPVETFLALYETHSSIAAFTRPQAISKLTLSQIQSTNFHPIFLLSTLYFPFYTQVYQAASLPSLIQSFKHIPL